MVSERGVISYPIPAYQNLPIEPQFYQPNQFVISAISLGITTTVTATADMNYVIGQLVRLIIPPPYGSYQLNNMSGYVLSLPSSTQVEISIDSSQNVDAYIAYVQPTIPTSAQTVAQIIAIGDVNQGAINATGRVNNGTFIPGSFINISPN